MQRRRFTWLRSVKSDRLEHEEIFRFQLAHADGDRIIDVLQLKYAQAFTIGKLIREFAFGSNV